MLLHRAAVQCIPVSNFMTLQFDYLWVLLQKASLADRIPPQISLFLSLSLYTVQNGLCNPPGKSAMCVFC